MIDPRGHRPVTRENYTPVVAAPPPVSGRRRGQRPTPAPTKASEEEKKQLTESGGCIHASETMVCFCII